MERRNLIKGLLCLPVTPLAYGQSFDDFLADQDAGAKNLSTEFEAYKSQYLKAYQDYRQAIMQEWDEVLTTTPTQWVSYSKDKKTRTVVDYERNQISVTVRADDPRSEPESLIKLAKQAIKKPQKEALKEDPVISKLHDGANQLGEQNMTGMEITDQKAETLAKKGRLIEDQDSKGATRTLVVNLPEEAESERARQYLPIIVKYSKQYNVSAPLVFAIMHTESSFNPLAQSHIPAFGLMQIVPNSAGKDVQRLIYKRNKSPSPATLFNPEQNIQHGIAYLHILQDKYLAQIKDPRTREQCVIAAYNTGAGNVARAFVGSTNIKKAAKVINTMSADRVYQHLRKRLHYAEARGYVLKVNQRLRQYRV
ncbi:transglycosylase SLT domain-containing protein [Bermanella sp. R86510]|uniref:transglycosylase SLT domain-containing protein n=1 Tax=unclassified Bermanella TaxID=2627862 RepID=UPI0037CB6EB9